MTKEINFSKLENVEVNGLVQQLTAENGDLRNQNTVLHMQIDKLEKVLQTIYEKMPDVFPDSLLKEVKPDGDKPDHSTERGETGPSQKPVV